jgi:hypothetical protein
MPLITYDTAHIIATALVVLSTEWWLYLLLRLWLDVQRKP